MSERIWVKIFELGPAVIWLDHVGVAALNEISFRIHPVLKDGNGFSTFGFYVFPFLERSLVTSVT